MTSQRQQIADLTDQNDALRKALDMAMIAMLDIPRSRIEKEQRYPHQDAEQGMSYRTCAQESLHRGQQRHSEILDFLAERGAL
jgi:hypothetical protein